MRPFYIQLKDHELVGLFLVAKAERRRPADQAAVLIAEGLAQRGALGERKIAPAPRQAGEGGSDDRPAA